MGKKDEFLLELRGHGPSKLWPEAVGVLENISVPLFNEKYKLRRPIGVYNTSLVTVAQRMRLALDAYDLVDVQNPGDSPPKKDRRSDADENLLIAYQDLLFAMMGHLEDCDGIVRSFFKPSDKFTKDPKVRTYKRALKWYRRRIGVAVNAIKHDQNRLRLFWMAGAFAWSRGYFVESYRPGRGLGSNPDVHAGGDTAFSFAYDFRLHFVELYAIGGHLRNFVVTVDPRVVAEANAECPWALVLGERISALRNFPFPNEIDEPNPLVTVLAKGKSSTLKVGLTGGGGTWIPITAIPGPIQMGASYSGDGATRSFQIPYMSLYPRVLS